MKPRARSADLLVEDVGGETLVYDLARHQAHCLGPVLAEVWRRCDGRTTPEQIARAVARRTGEPLDDHALTVALRRLARARLLDDGASRTEPVRARRELLRKAAAVAGLSLVSVSAPRASEAATCITVAACQALGNKFCTGQRCCAPAPAGRFCNKKGSATLCNCNTP